MGPIVAGTTQQQNYLLQWFSSWSEMQKGDFQDVLLHKFAGKIASLHPNPRPSLFHCQIKLFHEWFDAWSEAERGNFLEQLRALDSNFVSKVESESLIQNGLPEDSLQLIE